jgi:hypothetical protein
MGGHDRSARALSRSRLIFQPVAAGAVGARLRGGSPPEIPKSVWT